ncbi:hypothetical protein [Moraxella sp. ZY210820]|uniref:hypothetical protein n=1 Tax=unclassified Moraxella TaxID=2685852 RepID=UPI002730AA4B|nr:hypothetical protein [Moraxella sp. ZY210820]WLF83723.1 hypothetical protein LU301_10805 [Moraxella sp. ZY210820]
MLMFTTTEAKQNFDRLTGIALTQPVSITQQGRVILEVMTPQEKEKMIQERVKQIMFAQFVDDAVEAHEHYIATGLHTTHDEMKAWVNSLSTNTDHRPPVCHK